MMYVTTLSSPLQPVRFYTGGAPNQLFFLTMNKCVCVCVCVCVFQCQPTALLRASGSAQDG